MSARTVMRSQKITAEISGSQPPTVPVLPPGRRDIESVGELMTADPAIPFGLINRRRIESSLSRDDRDAAEYRDSLEIMRKSVQRLTRIVRDLFLLARGDAGQYPMRNERFYLDEVVAQTVQGLYREGAPGMNARTWPCRVVYLLRGFKARGRGGSDSALVAGRSAFTLGQKTATNSPL